MARMLGVQRGNFDLIGKGRGQLGDFRELLVRISKHRLQFHGILRLIAQQLVVRPQIGRGRFEGADPDAP